MNYLQLLLATEPELIFTFLRIVAGIIIFPYGMQKLMGWFGGTGLHAAFHDLKAKGLPVIVAFLIIIGQSLGSVALILGLFSRFAAFGNIIIFTGAMITHLPEGWMLNWFLKKKGEGVEYFFMLLSLLIVVFINGSGAYSIDRWLITLLNF